MALFSGKGDQGKTGLIGGARLSKSDPVFEVIGTLDEVNASLGLARSQCKEPLSAEIILQVQKDLQLVMGDVASSLETPQRRSVRIQDTHVQWLEKTIATLAQSIETPNGWLIPGDVYPAALLDVARAVVRRAERRFVEYTDAHPFSNQQVLLYLNRLSTLCFALELLEISGNTK